jgi:hypothetical protein
MSRRSLPLLALVAALGVFALAPTRAEAQYRSYTFGFEAGYMGLTTGTEMKAHNIGLGLMGSYKLSDHWWFAGKALVSFPGELSNSPNTVVMLHLVPASVSYYFLTDEFRPHVGLTNSFQIFINNSSDQTILWGPGVNAGFEVRLKRDLFLGVRSDAYMMLKFSGPPAAVISVTSQLIFFL